MSHRSRINEKKKQARKSRLETAGKGEPALPPQLPPFQGYEVRPGEPPELHPTLDVVIDAEKTGIALRNGAEPSLWACLKRLDTDNVIMPKLKKPDIEGVPRDKRALAYKAVVCAIWTDKARKAGLLQWLIDRRIVAFPHRKTYERAIPAVLPIVDEIPGFVEVFAGALQDIVKGHLLDLEMIPAPYIDADYLPPGKKAEPRGLLPPPGSRALHIGEFYEGTEQALSELFEVTHDDPERANAQAREYVRYFFIWLNAQNILQHIISGLGEGDPYIRKKRTPDGGFTYVCVEPAGRS
jgi:hypothetical protein